MEELEPQNQPPQNAIHTTKKVLPKYVFFVVGLLLLIIIFLFFVVSSQASSYSDLEQTNQICKTELNKTATEKGNVSRELAALQVSYANLQYNNTKTKIITEYLPCNATNSSKYIASNNISQFSSCLPYIRVIEDQELRLDRCYGNSSVLEETESNLSICLNRITDIKNILGE